VDPGVEQNSVGLLADECLAGHQCADGPIRKALLVALRYDKSADVRLEALNGLKPYVAEDMRVRDGVLEALMDDSDATVRSRAIELLQPVEADSSVREVLHTVASEDDNPHIRTVSRAVLDQLPQIQ
jgi:HEAT repeat protein